MRSVLLTPFAATAAPPAAGASSAVRRLQTCRLAVTLGFSTRYSPTAAA